MAEEKFYTCCVKCEEYMPLFHPKTVHWSADHTKRCREKEWKKDKMTNLSGETQEVMIFGYEDVGESPIFYARTPPPGFTCVVGPMEELAYSVPGTRDRLD